MRIRCQKRSGHNDNFVCNGSLHCIFYFHRREWEAAVRKRPEAFCFSWEFKLYSFNTAPFGELIAGAGTVGNASGAFTTGISAVWGVWGQALGCVVFVILYPNSFITLEKKGRCLLRKLLNIVLIKE